MTWLQADDVAVIIPVALIIGLTGAAWNTTHYGWYKRGRLTTWPGWYSSVLLLTCKYIILFVLMPYDYYLLLPAITVPVFPVLLTWDHCYSDTMMILMPITIYSTVCIIVRVPLVDTEALFILVEIRNDTVVVLLFIYLQYYSVLCNAIIGSVDPVVVSYSHGMMTDIY